jgi:hypothetical protein
MRTPIYLLMAALLVGGCTHYHATPAGSPSVDRVSEPERPEPLELDIGRPHGSQLPIQTSRPAYVAIFEIIPNRGVTLIYPAAAHQQNMLVSGLTWVPLWWSPRRVTFNSDRYIYAVASEEPLNLSGETFASGYFSRVLGLPVYRADRPYSTMRAISNAVVPNVEPEEWAEDVHVLTPTYHTEVYRTARIYCAGGRFFDVPDDMVSRVWCPTRTRVVIVDGRPRSREYPVGRPTRPDSVFGQGGTRIRLEPRRPRGPIARVVDPDDRGRGRGRDARDERDDRDKDSEKPEPKGRGRVVDLIKDARDAARDEAKEREKAEREREKEERERQRREAKEERERERREAEEARRREAEERKAERDERKDDRSDERDERKDERREERQERRDEPKQQGQAREEKREEKQEEKREEKQEEKRAEPQEKQEKKGRGSISDMIKEAKEKKNKP